jgi:hypothetical protein
MIVSSYFCDKCGDVYANLWHNDLPPEWVEVQMQSEPPKHYCSQEHMKEAMG